MGTSGQIKNAMRTWSVNRPENRIVNPASPVAPSADQVRRPPTWIDWMIWRWLLLAGLYVLGIYHWIIFYQGGNFSLLDIDWPKDRDYCVLLKEALVRGQVPYHMSVIHQSTDRFLGLPETILSPQILLLPYVEIGTFFLCQTLLLYTFGFLGCLLIRRRYQLGLMPFALLFLLFNFSGYITSHLAVGHSMWNGYFLLPFFCLWVLELLDGPAARPALLLALVLFGMMLQGCFHHVVWCWLFLVLLVVFNPRYWRSVLVVLGGSAALSIHRIGPAVVTFWDGHRGFYAGYPTLSLLLDSLIHLMDHDPEAATAPRIRSEITGRTLGWHEYDMYVGILGLAALVYFGIVRRLRCGPGRDEHRYRELDAPLLVMVFLSLNYFYAPIASLPLPLISAEAVSSRFFIIPLVFLMVLAAVHMQHFLEQTRPTAALYVLLIGGLLQTACVLAEHSWMWRTLPVPDGTSAEPPTVPVRVYRDDPLYVAVVQATAALSGAALAGWVFLFVRLRRCERLLIIDPCPVDQTTQTGG